MASKPISIILCGKTREIGNVAIKLLKPEYEVVYFVSSVEEGIDIIPKLLKEDQNPKAVATGGGYDEQAVEMMRNAALISGAKHVPWLRPDSTKPAPPLGPEYAKAVSDRLKEKLKSLSLGDNAKNSSIEWY